MKARSIITIGGVAAIALLAAGVAYGATTYSVTSTAPSNKAGSASKPAPFVGSYEYRNADTDGGRPLTPTSWAWKWNGVVINGKGFPTCTPEQIDAAQSDAVCPKGSLVGEGPFEALLGPESDTKANTSCTGKSVRIYNSGPATQTFLLVGPGTKCAGVGYLPPIAMKLKTSGGSTTSTVVLPTNITHPLPGVAGALPLYAMKYKKLSRKSGGKTIYYMSSTSCKGTRKITWTAKDPAGTHVSTGTVGKCVK